MQTTLNKIRKFSPCESGWVKLLKHLGKTQADDEPLDFLTILKSNGLNDALWCLKSAPIDWQSNVRMFAVWCAKQVEHLMNDDSKNALVVAQNHALGLATDVELKAAADVAWAASWAAARADAWAAWAAACAARAAARADAGDASLAAGAAAWDARAAADAARAAARADAWAASCDAAGAAACDAGDAARAAQKEMFIAMCEGKAPWQQ